MSRILFFLSICVIGGAFAYSLFLYTPSSKELEPYFQKEVVLEGKVSKDVQLREYNMHVTLQPLGMDASVLITTDRFSHISYRDILRAQGILESPPVFEDFNYKEYLETKGIGALMKNPKIEVVQEGNPGIFAIKQKFREVLFQNTSSSTYAVLAALLLGDQGTMSNDLKDKLNKTGLRHIIAISGQHIVILMNMLLPFLLSFGLWKRQAILISFIFLILFILLTGMEASAIRAGIMGGVVLMAQYLGRMQYSLHTLTFAAALMLLQNPLLLTRDVGFQLSFLATLGIILAFPLFRKLLRKIPETFGVRDILAMNFSAQLFTLPVLIYNFGYVSLISVITNILVLPVIPLLLALGFIFLIAGSLWSFLGLILVFPMSLLANYMILITEIFSKIPFAIVEIKNIPIVFFLAFYSAAIFLLQKFKREYELF